MRKSLALVGVAVVLSLVLGYTLGVSAQERPVRIVVNGKEIQCDPPAFIRGDRAFVPVRFVAEALGSTVDWDPTTWTVVIHTRKCVALRGRVSYVVGNGPEIPDVGARVYLWPKSPEPLPRWGNDVIDAIASGRDAAGIMVATAGEDGMFAFPHLPSDWYHVLIVSAHRQMEPSGWGAENLQGYKGHPWGTYFADPTYLVERLIAGRSWSQSSGPVLIQSDTEITRVFGAGIWR